MLAPFNFYNLIMSSTEHIPSIFLDGPSFISCAKLINGSTPRSVRNKSDHIKVVVQVNRRGCQICSFADSYIASIRDAVPTFIRLREHAYPVDACMYIEIQLSDSLIHGDRLFHRRVISGAAIRRILRTRFACMRVIPNDGRYNAKVEQLARTNLERRPWEIHVAHDNVNRFLL